MTKLTIQLDWKTFVPDPDLTWIEKEVRSWVKTGEIMELQPQEEKQPTYEEMVAMGMPTELVWMQWGGEETIMSLQDDWKREHGFLPQEEKTEETLAQKLYSWKPWEFIKLTPEEFEQVSKMPNAITGKLEQSILQKLKAELEKMIKENNDDSEYSEWVSCTCDYLLELLNELEKETEEQNIRQWMEDNWLLSKKWKEVRHEIWEQTEHNKWHIADPLERSWLTLTPHHKNYLIAEAKKWGLNKRANEFLLQELNNPTMPNTLRERFEEKFWDWTLWFDEIVEFLEQEISLVRQEALKEWEESMKQKMKSELEKSIKWYRETDGTYDDYVIQHNKRIIKALKDKVDFISKL